MGKRKKLKSQNNANLEHKLYVLESENYSAMQELTDADQKTIRKIHKYISTFPLGSYEIEHIKKELIGMAKKAEAQNKHLADILGKPVKTYCNDLLRSKGIRIPGGYKYLRIAGWFYHITGWAYRFACAFLVYALVFAIVESADRGIETSEFILEFYQAKGSAFVLNMTYYAVVVLFGSIFYCKAGKRAKQYSGDVTKAENAMKWGIAIAISTIIMVILQALVLPPLSPGEATTSSFSIASIASYIFPIIYIMGAYRNKQESSKQLK